MVNLVQGHDGAAGATSVRIDLAPADLNLARMRRARLARLRRELAQREIPCCVLHDPVNLRYACGARNMQIFSARNPARYLFVAVEGPAILFEFEGCHHLAQGLETIDEIRPATTASFVAAGPRLSDVEVAWAREIAELARRYDGGTRRIALERVNAGAALALAAEGFTLLDAQEPVERARAIKDDDEIACIRESIAAVEAAVARLEGAIRPGVTENALWSHLHQAVIERDGDYIETRLLNSGPRSNPWFQESSELEIEAGDLVALDTDVVGCHGYYCDFSRTFLCGDGKPSAEQRKLYGLAHEQVHHNLDLLKPGMSFREFSAQAWRIPEPYRRHRYYLLAHGVGMTGEYPYLLHAMDFPKHGYDGIIEPGMTLCLESFIGDEAGGEGVKLEQQVLVTETGIELLTHYPFSEDLLHREI